jgi:SAM-dependent methyltransferase
MINDVVDLRDFYASSLGHIVQKDIKNSIQKIWPPCKNQIILGVGYTPPFLNNFDSVNNTIYSFMPAQQGVLGWPSCQPTMSALVSEGFFPLSDQSIDRILCIHMLENCHDPHTFLQEAWRILKPEGRILFVVPNRRGLWACVDNNPFGYGQPYTMTQLTTLLRAHLFTPLFQYRGLYAPPTSSKFFSLMRPLLERIGPKCLQKFSGVIYVEAIKQVYAVTGKPIFVKRLNLPPLPELVGQHAKAFQLALSFS